MDTDLIIRALTAGMTDSVRAAFCTGFNDGVENPDELAWGMTYDDGSDTYDVRNEAYDYGATVGQQVARWERVAV